MPLPKRTGLLLVLVLQQCVTSASEENDSCAAGSGKCSEGMSGEGSTGWWTRLASLLSHKKSDIGSYTSRFSDNGTLEERSTTDEYYDLATDFYEYGWGSLFHFGSRYEGETRIESLVRHEHFLASKLGLKAGDKVGDLGMGIGGPLRNIAKFSGATVTGVTLNKFQITRANSITQKYESAAAAKRMNYVHGDFTNLVPKVFAPESLDAVYYIESACHISNRTEVFAESARALKKGGKLFTYEWVMTKDFDPKNEEHMAIKKGVEYGNGIENLISWTGPIESLKAAGYKIIEHGDLVELAEEWNGSHDVPWYFDIGREWSFLSFEAFKLSVFGQNTLKYVLKFVEAVGLVAEGASQTEYMLRQGAANLVLGGKKKIFTPMYYIVAEKI